MTAVVDAAPIHALDARILPVEALQNRLHHFLLKRSENSDLSFLAGGFDERFVLSLGGQDAVHEHRQRQGEAY
jgi:hypothetical protein